jgi:pilus assembly protein TadC
MPRCSAWAEELVVSHGALASVLGLVNAAIQAGVERTDALKALADRTGLDDIRGLVSLLCQSVRLPCGSIRRSSATTRRESRREDRNEDDFSYGLLPVAVVLPGGRGPAVLAVIRVLQTTTN